MRTAYAACVPLLALTAFATAQTDTYFADDFESHAVGAAPVQSAKGYGWRKVVDFEPSSFEVSHRPGGAQGDRCALLRSAGARAPVVDALLRLPERADATATLDLRFDTREPGYLALTFCQGNYARVCRLILERRKAEGEVRVLVEDGAKEVKLAEVATLQPGRWTALCWHNNARDNTASLAVNGKPILKAKTMEPRARFTRRGFSRFRLHAGKRGRVWIDNLRVTDNPMPRPTEPRLDYSTEPKEAIMCVDFFDLCYYASHRERRLYTPDDIEQLMVECKRAGIAFALWRVSACGSAVYRSEVEGRAFRRDPRPDAHAAADFIDRWDPLAEACRIGHRVGIPIWVWMTVYDEGYKTAGHYSKLLKEHPEYQWVDRTGTKYFTGVPCYAFPEARRFRVRMIEETCRYPVDGVFLSFRSHSVALPAYREAEEFGYEPPVVAEYQRRYGVDIRTEEFDRQKWHQLKGEYFTQLLREIRGAIGPRRPVHVIFMDYCEGPSGKSQHQLDIPTWVKEKLVDAIYVQGAAKTVPADFAQKYEFVRKLGAKLYCFRGTPDEEATFENIPMLVDLVKGTPFQGIALMEAYKFQILRGQKR